MKRFFSVLAMWMVLMIGVRAFGIDMDQAKPGENAGKIDPHGGMQFGPAVPQSPAAESSPAQSTEGQPVGELPVMGAVENRTAFQQQVKLDQFRLLSVQHSDTIKDIDSWARQVISAMRNRQTIDGADPVYTALDISFRPYAWVDRNIIYVQAIPVRQELARLAGNAAEGDRIMHEGLVSYNFLDRPEVQQKLSDLSLDMRQVKAVNKVQNAHELFVNLRLTLLMLPPDAAHRGTPWRHPIELAGNLGNGKQFWGPYELRPLPVLAGYSPTQSKEIKGAMDNLLVGWMQGDATVANHGIETLCAMLPAVDAPTYPSEAKRVTELWYNRTFYGTIANVFLYFICMTLFLMVAVGVTQKLEGPALALFAVAVLLHLTAMGVRWWIAGRIPIQNQFESVLGSALLGCIVGLALETWKRNGIFGMAFSFVGFLAMTACFTAPYVFGTDLGGAVAKVAGILDNYWLYIHVNVVIGSYALIGASFLVGVLYLSMKLWYWINPVEGDGGGPGGLAIETGSGGGGTAVLESRTLLTASTVQASRLRMLEGLDQANMVILQMAFWFLGTGIICGAVWADHSWGRPWGWDPKETFALVTWMVYLVIVHLRFVTKARSDVTAWLSVVGFGVMMFNWIGVNFWLVGLHSYA